MAKAGETFTHAVTGSKLIFVKTAQETGGEYLQVEQIAKPNADFLPAHVHMVQTETFKVLSGRGKYQMGGEEHMLQEGEEISFPPGTAHKNPLPVGSEDLHMLVTITPALDFHVILETIVRAPEKGDANPDGSVKKLHSAVLLNSVQSKTYMAGQSIAVQKALFPVLAFFGRLAGFKPGYDD